jgi:hypothetical protein
MGKYHTSLSLCLAITLPRHAYGRRQQYTAHKPLVKWLKKNLLAVSDYIVNPHRTRSASGTRCLIAPGLSEGQPCELLHTHP